MDSIAWLIKIIKNTFKILESFLDQLGLDDEENLEKRDKSVWEYNSNDSKNGEKDHFFNTSSKSLVRKIFYMKSINSNNY